MSLSSSHEVAARSSALTRAASFTILSGALIAAAGCADRPPVLPTAPTIDASPAFSRSALTDSLSQLDASGGRRQVMETLLRAKQRANALASGRVLSGRIQYHGGFVIAGTDRTGQTAIPKVAVLYWGGSAATPIYAGGPLPNSCWNVAGPVEANCSPAGPDQSLLGFFLSNLGGSPYFKINTTYYGDMAYLGGGTSYAYVSGKLQYSQYYADPNPVPSSVTDAQMAAELNTAFLNGTLSWDPTGSTIYTIFTPSGVNAGGGFGTQYCAYHGHFLVDSHIDPRGVNALYAVEPYNADTPNCTAQTVTPNGDLAADTEVNTTAHELEESVTDGEGFRSPGWYDAYGDENADKCAWVWGPYSILPNGAAWNISVGGRQFLVQENWKRSGSCAQHL